MVKRSYRQRSRKRTRTERRVSRNRISKKTRNYRKRRSGRRARNKSRKKSRIYKNMRGGAAQVQFAQMALPVDDDDMDQDYNLFNEYRDKFIRLLDDIAGNYGGLSSEDPKGTILLIKGGLELLLELFEGGVILGPKAAETSGDPGRNMFIPSGGIDPMGIVNKQLAILGFSRRPKDAGFLKPIRQSLDENGVTELAYKLYVELSGIGNKASLPKCVITPLHSDNALLDWPGVADKNESGNVFLMVRLLNDEDVETLQFPEETRLDLCNIKMNNTVEDSRLQLIPANYLLSTMKKDRPEQLTDSARPDDRDNMVHKYLQGVNDYGREPRNKHGIHGFSLYDISSAVSTGSIQRLLDEMRENFRVFAERRIVGGKRTSDGARSLFITAFRATETKSVREDLGSAHDEESELQSTAQLRGGALEGGDFNSVFTSPPSFVDGGHQSSLAENAESMDDTEASLDAFRIVPDSGIKYARLGRLMGVNNVNSTEINFIGDGLIRGYHISLLDAYRSGIVTSPDILKVYEQVFNIDLYGQRFWK